jgi:hypothetical protein
MTQRTRVNFAIWLLGIAIVINLVLLFSGDTSPGWPIAAVILLGVGGADAEPAARAVGTETGKPEMNGCRLPNVPQFSLSGNSGTFALGPSTERPGALAQRKLRDVRVLRLRGAAQARRRSSEFSPRWP